MRTLPNFLVVGAQRSGTTLLHAILAAHPEIEVPRRRKEVHYFDTYHDRGAAWYAEFFQPRRDETAIGEVTPDYLFRPEVPDRIADLLPDCRIVVILRDPVDRAWSGYKHLVRTTMERRGFLELVAARHEILTRGYYAEQLARYRDRFPQILVLSYRDLIAQPASELERLAGFLQLRDGWPDPGGVVGQRINEAPRPTLRGPFVLARGIGRWLTRHDLDAPVRWAKALSIPALFGARPAMARIPPGTATMLAEHYRADTAALEAMLGRSFGWRSSRTPHVE